DHINGRVHQLGAEAGRQIVAPRLQENDLQIRMPLRQLVESVEVHRRVLADGRVRATARLDADDPISGQRLTAHQKLHVLARENVVREDAEPVALAHRLAQRIDERRFSGPNGSTDADAKGAFPHDRNNLEWRYCCAIADTSIAGAND